MATLEAISEKARAVLDARNQARERSLSLSREIIRTAANSIRAAHRGELERAAEMLSGARASLDMQRALREPHPDLYGAGYVHDCQKEYAEACAFLAVVSGTELPEPEALGVEYAAYLNGLGEAVGEMRRHTLDRMRQGRLREAEMLLGSMDEIYHLLVTLDYPDALTGGLRRTTDSTRGIIEKTRGELTVALRGEDLRAALERAVQALGACEVAPTGVGPVTEEGSDEGE